MNLDVMQCEEVRSEIEINSYPESVWKILTDFATYDQWNPFINQIIGLPTEGSKGVTFI